MTLVQYPQQDNSSALKKQIIALENTVWKSDKSGQDFPSAPNTYVTSFVILEGSVAVCHAAVRKKILIHFGQKYSAYGLSEVVTHPNYQKMGLGSKILLEAANYIAYQHPDLGIFTCEPSKVPFYAKGGWQPCNCACLVGGTEAHPFRSDQLGLTTMINFFSAKAKSNQLLFENTDIFLELGENQLW